MFFVFLENVIDLKQYERKNECRCIRRDIGQVFEVPEKIKNIFCLHEIFWIEKKNFFFLYDKLFLVTSSLCFHVFKKIFFGKFWKTLFFGKMKNFFFHTNKFFRFGDKQKTFYIE